jgi:uncharacterized protein (TIGR02271 family)
MTAHDGNGGPGLEVDGAAAVVLHEERLLVSTQHVATERVRITKRIVTTTRTIDVPVRVEQLVITREPLDAGGPVARAGAVPGEPVVIVLHEEVPEIALRVVATERVVIGTRSVAEERVVTTELAAEVVEVVTSDVTR